MRFQNKYSDILTKEFLEQAYLIDKKGPYIIAKEIGCGPHTVYSYLKKHNIKQKDLSQSVFENQKFNKLTTIKIIGKRKNGCNLWLCQCECGKLTKVDSGQLNNHSTTSCGCNKNKKRQNNKNWKGCGELGGNKWQSIKYSAKYRKINFDITIEEAWKLFEQQNGLCALTGQKITFETNTASLDRIDSYGDYEIGNIQWLHKDINKIKYNINENEFIDFCNLVVHPIPNRIHLLDIDNIYSGYYKDIIHNAKKRKLLFELDEKTIVEIYNKQSGQCYITGLDITLPQTYNQYRARLHTASLDRIDNNKFYSIINCAWCHKFVNQSRKNFTLEYYKSLCQMVINYKR